MPSLEKQNGAFPPVVFQSSYVNTKATLSQPPLVCINQYIERCILHVCTCTRKRTCFNFPFYKHPLYCTFTFCILYSIMPYKNPSQVYWYTQLHLIIFLMIPQQLGVWSFAQLLFIFPTLRIYHNLEIYDFVHICIILEEYMYFKHTLDIFILFSIKRSYGTIHISSISVWENIFISATIKYYYYFSWPIVSESFHLFADYFNIFVCD